jgi:hypothetical protein
MLQAAHETLFRITRLKKEHEMILTDKLRTFLADSWQSWYGNKQQAVDDCAQQCTVSYKAI